MDEIQKDELQKFKAELEQEQEQITAELNGLEVELKRLRTRKSVVERVIARNGEGAALERFKVSRLNRLSDVIREKTADLNKKQEEYAYSSGQIEAIVTEIGRMI